MDTEADKKRAGLSRRDLFKLGGAAALGVAGTSVLAGCGSPSTSTPSKDAGAVKANDGVPSFLIAPDPITTIAETKEYDIVVVGAGAAGVPAALSAREVGAKVAVLQKESQAVSQGNSGCGILIDKSDEAGVEALVSRLVAANQHRPYRKLIENWAWNSGEAVNWVIKRSAEGKAPVSDTANTMQRSILSVNGYNLNYVTSFFGPKPSTTGDGMKALASVAEKEGVEFFYSTPGVQLVKEGEKVVGVIGKKADGTYVRFNASKGVILATGDYENNEEMCNYYVPDLKYFGRKQQNKTGDGHRMGYWAGAAMEPFGHTKMLHDFDAGPSSMCDMPFLVVNNRGVRFVNETVQMSLLNNYLRSEEDAGWYSQIFDSNYMTQAATWPGKLVDPKGLETYMPDVEGEKVGVFKDQIRTFKADTLDELAKKLEIPADALKKSVARNNELAALGKDLDFGKPAQFFNTIDTPPFFGIHRQLRISTTCSGLMVDENNQALDSKGGAIGGLFVIGNCAGRFYGGVDYPLDVFGLSLGRCYTAGRMCGKYVASL